REIAARPVGNIGNSRNGNTSFIENPDDAAGGKLVGPDRTPEAFDRGSDDQHRLQLTRRIPDGVRDRKDPAAVHPALQGLGDREPRAGHDLTEEGAVADAVTLA